MKGKGDVLRRILQFIRRYMPAVALSLIASAVGVAFTLYVPVLSGDAVDLALGMGRVDFAALAPVLARIVVAVAVVAACRWISGALNSRVVQLTVRDVRNQAFERLQRVPLKAIDNRDRGDVVSRVIADVDQFADGLLMGFTQLFTGVLTILGTLGFMVYIHPGIALVVVLITPVSLLVASFVARKTYRMFQLQSSARGSQTAYIEEMVTGRDVVEAFGREQAAMDAFDRDNEQLRKYSLRATFFSSITNPSTRFVNSLVYTGVGVAGALAAAGGAFTVGMLSCFLSYANQYTKPFNEISGVVTELQNALACAERVFQLMDEPEETPDGQVVLQKPAGNVTLKDVAFSYVPEKPLIRNFSLEVRSGQRVAIVGPTGCGKTTVINLLMRFYDPVSGEILVDGVNTQDVTRASLRDSWGMVLQDTWLREGTVRENIRMGRPDATDADVEQAARQAHAHAFIRRLPNGYDTVLASDGGSLSQGQKQLLCIARVMLRQPPMLILDEATSSIDTRTELSVQSAFQKLMQGRTSFVVAHRLSTIRTADVILAMRDGQIVEVGSHDELMRKNGFYAQLYNSQF